MSNASQTSAGPRARGGSTQALCLLVLAVYTPLAAYLFRATQHTGDGAAYTLQAAGGAALDRAVHGGWLVPLSAWTRLLGWVGVDPSAATNLLGAIAMGGALVGIALLGAELAGGGAVRGRRWDGLVAPATALGAATVWDAATFCEIYGPLAAFCVGAVLACRKGRGFAAAAWLFLALATHPGALALLPGLLVLGTDGRGADGALRRPPWVALGGALTLAALWVLLVGPEAWLGPRGILAPGADVGPWRGLQRAWRLLARDLGVTALPLLIGGVIAWTGSGLPRRWLTGAGLLLLGTVTGLDRFSDNPAALPLFVLTCPLAALAPAAVRALPERTRRPAVLLLGAVLVLGVAEATTRQDAIARRAVREQALREARCDQTPPAWAERMLHELACD